MDIKYQDVIFSDLNFTDKEEIKKNCLDRLMNVSKMNNILLSKEDVLEITPMAGSIVIRIYFNNNYDMRVKVKSLVDKLTPNPSVLNIYYKQTLLKTQSITSSVNFLTEQGSQLFSTNTTPKHSSQQINPKTGLSGGTILPSDFGVKTHSVIKCVVLNLKILRKMKMDF